MKKWLDIILNKENVEKAIKYTVAKNTGAGVDGVTANQLKENWQFRGDMVIRAIYMGKYYPLPAKRVYVNKGNGKKRMLTIPTMQDRMLQRCIVNVLGDYYEQYFHNNSFGFRIGRGTKDAIERAILYMNEGLEYVIDLDIKKCFDTIRHSIVMDLLRKNIDDWELLLLIRRYLKLNVICGKKIIHVHHGVAQGGPISSLLANIVLNELDWYLDEQKCKFVRYADDVVIFCKTYEVAQQVLEMVKIYLKKQLGLNVNMEKTKIVKAEELEYLGMAFKKQGQKHKESLSDSIKQRMSLKLQKCFRRTYKKGIAFWDMLGGFHRGWLNYYQNVEASEIYDLLEEIQSYEDTIMREYMEQYASLAQQQKALENWSYTTVEKYFLPPITLTPDEAAKLSTKQTDVDTYRATEVNKFIRGEISLDKFDEFRQGLKDRGVEEVISYNQAALDRYVQR